MLHPHRHYNLFDPQVIRQNTVIKNNEKMLDKSYSLMLHFSFLLIGSNYVKRNICHCDTSIVLYCNLKLWNIVYRLTLLFGISHGDS